MKKDHEIYSKLLLLNSENLKKELINFMDYLLTKQFSETQVVPKKIPQFGCAKGKFRMSDDFDAYLELR
jgi:hypothetical protein